MGWVWRDEDDDVNSPAVKSGGVSKFEIPNLSNDDRCSTRKIVKSQCRTEEVEPGKFIRKCEKTEQILKECVGRPTEVLQSTKEYTEDDVTDEVVKGSFSSKELEPFNFPGLRDDIEAIERSFFGNLSRFFEAAEDIKNGFFEAISSPHLHDDRESSSSSSSSVKRGIPIEDNTSNNSERGDIDLSGLARDV